MPQTHADETEAAPEEVKFKCFNIGRFPADLHRRIKKIAADRDISMHDLIVFSIGSFLKRYDQLTEEEREKL